MPHNDEARAARGTPKGASKPSAPRRNPKDVPIGTGMANRARNAIAGRTRQVDDAVEQMERGTLQNARRPRSY